MTNDNYLVFILAGIICILAFIIHKLVQALNEQVKEEVHYIQEIALLYRDDGKEERDDGV